MTDVSGLYPSSKAMLTFTFNEGYRPEASIIFLLCGTGIFLALFLSIRQYPTHQHLYIASFLLLVTVVKDIGPKRQLYFYSMVMELFLCYSYLSDSTLRTSIYTQFPLTSDCCKGYRAETSYTFLLLGAGIVLVLFLSIRQYPTHQHFLHSS